jgi:23S rRNA (pseudouridine1915-N3)-methyltransferase
MRIELIFIGKTKEAYLASGIEDFHKRLKRYAEVDIRVCKDVRPASKPDQQVKREEGKVLLSHVDKKTFLVALDPGGRELSSEQLAERLGNWQDSGRRHISIVLGGALGLDDEILARADLVVSLSRMTFTHELARLVIMEQLYRAFNIRAGTGYHK